MFRRFIYFLSILGAMGLVLTRPALAASILIWPIDPVIKEERGASVLWLENRGTTPAMMQVRILAWTQIDGEDRYNEQDAIVASPPTARIPSGARQLIRLIAQRRERPADEAAYRVLIDEIPADLQPVTSDAGKQAAVRPETPAIRFRMRYSIPLFVYGTGAVAATDAPGPAAARKLHCALVQRDRQKFIQITNLGETHARLTDVGVEQNGKRTSLANGLFGYVLPGSTVSRPFPAGMTGPADLSMKVGNKAEPLHIRCDGQ